MSQDLDAIWVKNLTARFLGSSKLEKRASYYAGRYGGLLNVGDLENAGHEGLTRAVLTCPRNHPEADEYCLYKVNRAMLDEIRVEARDKRVDKAAHRAAAELLALYEASAGVLPDKALGDLAHHVAVATFVAMTEEATHGSEDDLIAREEYATGMKIIEAVLADASHKQKQLFALYYKEGMTFEEASEKLHVHINTVGRWHKSLLDEMKERMLEADILRPPGRGGAPRVPILDRFHTPDGTPNNDTGDPRRKR